MKTYIRTAFACSFLGLMACGGSGGSKSTPNTGTSGQTPSVQPVLSVSTTSLTYSSKRFRDLPERQRIEFTYDTSVVDFIMMNVVGIVQIGEPAEGASTNLFRTSTDSSDPPQYVEVFPVYAQMEGGTYIDEFTLQPRLKDGTNGDIVTVDLTLVHEPTTPVTVELNNPEDLIVEVTEDGPPIRVPATLNAGNVVRWQSNPTRFVQDGSVDVVTTDPLEGVGTEQVDIVITPTDTLIETLKDDTVFNLPIQFEDKDASSNFQNWTELSIEVRLADPSSGKSGL